jgi:uncharacterized protein YeaO (DUF488 family)
VARQISIQRIYDDTVRIAFDYRVFVDRLWPRGRARESIDYDEWNKVIAPSPDLRRWYGHEVERFAEFARRYQDELAQGAAAEHVARLRATAREHHVILLTASRDLAHSHAMVLSDTLRARVTGADA